MSDFIFDTAQQGSPSHITITPGAGGDGDGEGIDIEVHDDSIRGGNAFLWLSDEDAQAMAEAIIEFLKVNGRHAR